MLWKDLEKHPPLFRVGRLPRQFYLPNEFARAMSNNFPKSKLTAVKYIVFFLPNSTKRLYMTFSKNLERLDNKEIGL